QRPLDITLDEVHRIVYPNPEHSLVWTKRQLPAAPEYSSLILDGEPVRRARHRKSDSQLPPSQRSHCRMIRGNKDVPGLARIATVATRHGDRPAQIATIMVGLTTNVKPNEIAEFHD